MKHGLKDHHIAALISKVNNELRERYKDYGLPQSTHMTVKLAVEDYLSENQLRLDHSWSDAKLHEQMDELLLSEDAREAYEIDNLRENK